MLSASSDSGASGARQQALKVRAMSCSGEDLAGPQGQPLGAARLLSALANVCGCPLNQATRKLRALWRRVAITHSRPLLIEAPALANQDVLGTWCAPALADRDGLHSLCTTALKLS